MNILKADKRRAVVAALVEGASVRSTVRMTGVAKNTVSRLLLDMGLACADLMDRTMRNLPCRRVQVDEIWSFVYAKAKNVPAAKRGEFGYGDVWTFTAIDADTKLMPCWLIGRRDSGCATAFVTDLAGRLANRIQLTTDGHNMYLSAVEAGFGGDVDYAQLQKIYESPREGHVRYSPPVCIGCTERKVQGNPDPDHISTSYVERANLTMRMGMRRFTRLTNAFSKKLENHAAAVALHHAHYNFCRRHQSLRITPAMAAKVTDRLWSLEDLVALLDRVPAN